MIINQSSISGIYKSFRVLFNNAFTDTQTHYQDIAMVVPSTGKENSYPWLGNFPGMKEWIGERKIQSLKAYDYSIKNRTFESTVEVNREDIEDDNIGIYSPVVAELGRTAKTHPDELLFLELLMNGWTATCYDGKPFFASDHIVGKETFSNNGGGSGSPWFLADLSRAVKPVIVQIRKQPQFVAKDKITDDNVFFQKQFIYGVDDRKNCGFGLWQLMYGSKAEFNATNYAAARAAMMGYKKENGSPIGIRPTHVIYGPSSEANVLKVLKADFVESTANVWRDTAKPLLVPWLP